MSGFSTTRRCVSSIAIPLIEGDTVVLCRDFEDYRWKCDGHFHFFPKGNLFVVHWSILYRENCSEQTDTALAEPGQLPDAEALNNGDSSNNASISIDSAVAVSSTYVLMFSVGESLIRRKTLSNRQRRYKPDYPKKV